MRKWMLKKKKDFEFNLQYPQFRCIENMRQRNEEF